MNKQAWIKAVAAQLEQPEVQVAPILEAGLDAIYQAMKREEKVTFVNFGTFYIDVRRSSTVFKFNPSQKWRALFGWSSTYKGDLCPAFPGLQHPQPRHTRLFGQPVIFGGLLRIYSAPM